MLDWGFANYEAVPTSRVGGLSFVISLVGVSDSFVCASATEKYITVKKGELDLVSVTNEYPRFLYSQKDKSQRVGRIVYRYNTEIIGISEIYTCGTHNVPKKY